MIIYFILSWSHFPFHCKLSTAGPASVAAMAGLPPDLNQNNEYMAACKYGSKAL